MTEFMRLEETYSLAVCVARYDFTQYHGFSTTVFGQDLLLYPKGSRFFSVAGVVYALNRPPAT